MTDPTKPTDAELEAAFASAMVSAGYDGCGSKERDAAGLRAVYELGRAEDARDKARLDWMDWNPGRVQWTQSYGRDALPSWSWQDDGARWHVGAVDLRAAIDAAQPPSQPAPSEAQPEAAQEPYRSVQAGYVPPGWPTDHMPSKPAPEGDAALQDALRCNATVMTVARGHLWGKADFLEGLGHERQARDLRNAADKLTDHIEAIDGTLAASQRKGEGA